MQNRESLKDREELGWVAARKERLQVRTILQRQVSLQPQKLYLLTLPAIQDRCSKLHDPAKQNKLEYFVCHPDNEDKAATFCIDIKVCSCTTVYL